MDAATLISVEEYLSTTYRPDCDYVDGMLMERHVGQKEHSDLQSELIHWFRARRQTFGVTAFVEMRVRVGSSRFRVPDVCVVRLPEPDERVFTMPPYVCIEVLSPEDSFPRLQERLDDYLQMGVENIWVLDPISRRGWVVTDDGYFEARDGVLKTHDGAVKIPMADLYYRT